MADWLDVAQFADLPDSEMVPVDADGVPIVLIRRGSMVYAYEDRCPHVGYPISIGHIDGNELVCTWHGACFSVENGEVLCPPSGGPLYAVDVRIMNDSVAVLVPESD